MSTKALRRAIEEATHNRGCSGQGVPTRKELGRLAKKVKHVSGWEISPELVDAQTELIDALLMKLERSLHE